MLDRLQMLRFNLCILKEIVTFQIHFLVNLFCMLPRSSSPYVFGWIFDDLTDFLLIVIGF